MKISKANLKKELQGLGVKVEGNYVNKSDLKKVIKAAESDDLSDQYAIYDMGWEDTSYFQGFGTYGTDFDVALYEVGSSAKDAVEQLIQRIWEMETSDDVKDAIAAELKELVEKAGEKADETVLVELSGSFNLDENQLKLNKVDVSGAGFGLEDKIDIAEDEDGKVIEFTAISVSGETAAEQLLDALIEEGLAYTNSDADKIMQAGSEADHHDMMYHIGVKVKSGTGKCRYCGHDDTDGSGVCPTCYDKEQER